jgi:DMSO reductase family type II enzyme chaperone
VKVEDALVRAQAYAFFSQAFLYPESDWTLDLSELADDLGDDLGVAPPRRVGVDAADLQAEHRRAFGLSGPLVYETEYGLPHEFRQSQELADIAGFYRAFGLRVGGRIRERPDHIAAELEFMAVLALKEACAQEAGEAQGRDVCREAQRRFLEDHLGRWVDLLAAALSRLVPDGPYADLARATASFVHKDAERLGVILSVPDPARTGPTPSPAEWDCGGCPLVEPALE